MENLNFKMHIYDGSWKSLKKYSDIFPSHKILILKRNDDGITFSDYTQGFLYEPGDHYQQIIFQKN